MAGIPVASFIRSVIDEGKKVIWPDRPTIINHTIMVVATIVVATLIFAGIDYGLQKLTILAINR